MHFNKVARSCLRTQTHPAGNNKRFSLFSLSFYGVWSVVISYCIEYKTLEFEVVSQCSAMVMVGGLVCGAPLKETLLAIFREGSLQVYIRISFI